MRMKRMSRREAKHRDALEKINREHDEKMLEGQRLHDEWMRLFALGDLKALANHPLTPKNRNDVA